MPKRRMQIDSMAQLMSLARLHTESALNILVEIMENKDTPPNVRCTAANMVLDRGWGRALQIETKDNPQDGERITKIVREIIHRNAEEALILDAAADDVLELQWRGNGKNGH